MENATCRTRVYLLANVTGILFLTDSNTVGLQKFSCDHRFRFEYRNFVKNFIIVNPHHLLPLSVQIALWMILIVFDLSVPLVSLFVIVYTSFIDLCVLKVICDLSLSVDCSPGGAKILVWKAASSHFVGTVITYEDFLRLILRNSFYALLCRRSVCTTPLNFNFSTFIRLANFNSFTSCESACLF